MEDNLPEFSTGEYDENLQEQRDEIFALQSIFNTEDDEKLKVLSKVSEDKQGLFTLLITVRPKPAVDVIQVDVALPVSAPDGEEEEPEGACAAPLSPAACSPPSLTRDISLSRSVSGQSWKGSFRVKFLSPLNLFATFPVSYPSSSAPNLHLACDWLTDLQLRALESQLENLWLESCNMPVVFTWVDWLENECLSHLGISDTLVLRPQLVDGGLDKASEQMEDGLNLEENLGATIAAMVRHNKEKSDEEFCLSVHLCEICYDEYPGTQFFRIQECEHAFCHTCVLAFCQLHVTQGTVEELRCPIQKCHSIVPPHVIQCVLPPEAYDRWETLLLQKTLDSMEDTVYCPRCGSVVIVEEDKESNLAHCTVCFYAFCTKCERSWHQGSSCETDEELLENMQEKETESMTGAVRKKFEEIRRRLEDEIRSKTYKEKATRPCPSCRVPVEKIGGCNKMTCKCGQFFCWICGKKIDGYNHFRTGSCTLFPGQVDTHANERAFRMAQRRPDAVIRMQAMMEVDPNLRNNQTRCPMCKQMSLKGLDRNNHIKCWNCKSNFCYVCGQRIVGPVTVHFAGTCPQHS